MRQRRAVVFDVKSFKIEKNVPIPEKASERAADLRKLLRSMTRGDSFVSPRGPHAVAQRVAKRNGMVLVCRSEESGLVRIWRVK